MTNTRKRPIAAVIAVLFLGGTAAQVGAQAPTASSTAVYQIASQPLGTALAQLAQQAGQTVSAPPGLLAGRQAPAVTGRMGLQQALDQLFAGSGLAARSNGTSIVVQAVPAADPTGDAALPAVVVKAAPVRETATGPVQGYRARRAASATRTDTAILDTPMAVQAVTRDLMDDQGTASVRAALQNVAGVFDAIGPDGNTMDNYNIRGFQTDSYGSSYLDGLKDFSRAPKDTVGLERVEVLKGPSAIMYGRIEPGGMVNRVSKRPQAEARTQLEQSVGSHQYLRTTLDSTGPIDTEGQWLYRVVGAFEDTDGFKQDTHNRRFYLSPQIEWRPNADTTVRATIDLLDDKRSWALTYGTIGGPTGPLNLPISTNLHDKNDHYKEDSVALRLEWSHRISPQWELRQRLNYFDRNGFARGSSVTAANAAGVYNRTYWGWDDESVRAWTTNLEAEGRIETAGIKHNILFGGDAFKENYNSGGWSFGGTPLPSSIYTPVQGTPYATNRTTQDFWYRNNNRGVFAQDQVSLLDDRLHLLGGVRYEYAESVYNYSNFGATNPLTSDDERTTYRAGALYKLTPALSIYASYVTGFGAPNRSTPTGQRLEPQTSQQKEVGAKWEISPTLFATLAAYELVKDHLTMTDPADPTKIILAGEATSKGIEMDLNGELAPRLDGSFGYAYTDARWTRSERFQGERVIGVPRHTLSAWLSWRLPAEGWKVGLGARYRSERLGVYKNQPALYPYTLDAYTVWNAMVGYSFAWGGGAATVQLNIDNLTDKRYYPTTYGGSIARIAQGEPRKATLSLRYQF